MKLIIEIEVEDKIGAYRAVNYLSLYERKGIKLINAKLGNNPVVNFKNTEAKYFMVDEEKKKKGLLKRQEKAKKNYAKMSLEDLIGFCSRKGIKAVGLDKKEIINAIIKNTFTKL